LYLPLFLPLGMSSSSSSFDILAIQQMSKVKSYSFYSSYFSLLSPESLPCYLLLSLTLWYLILAHPLIVTSYSLVCMHLKVWFISC
jgi:hypothetical protein